LWIEYGVHPAGRALRQLAGEVGIDVEMDACESVKRGWSPSAGERCDPEPIRRYEPVIRR
jgi:hypothetical protein